MQKIEKVNEIKGLKERIAEQSENKGTQCITMCGGSGCTSLGGQLVRDRFEKEIKNNGFGDKVEIKTVGCLGLCVNGPIVNLGPDDTFYQIVSENDVPGILEDTVKNGRTIDKLLYANPVTGDKIASNKDIPFFKQQERVTFRNCGKIDPTDINEYIRDNGYLALEKALKEMTSDDVINCVTESGLRGRGGGGFSTGTKWRCAQEIDSNVKYLICNGGAYKDRTILEGDPHSVIEGMVIAGYAIGARQGYFYVRAEDTITIKHLKKAIADAEALGVLGKNVLKKGFDFNLDIKESAGAFVCGEESALISFIEDARGMPRQKPPYPAFEGLNGKPTIVNNVETFANIAPILLNGTKWFSNLGTEKSPGSKLYVLEGKVNNTGLVEVSFGKSLREIITIGGGIANGRSFKSALIGGPSGGFVPKSFLDAPLEFDTIKSAGAVVGSSSLNVLDDSACIVEVTRLSISFLADESCGKCVPCRIGTKRMLEILTRITQGEAEMGDIDLLEQMATSIKDTALCGLGQTATNSVLTSIKHFRDEYESHIRDKHCHAAVCDSLAKSPCQNSCPASINVPEYVALAGKNEYGRCLELIRKRNPFSSVCGHICNHPCEILCRRGDLEESIAIKDIKRFASDFDPKLRKEFSGKPVDSTGKKVAVIGGGPGGLTAAFFLRLWGHEVVVFEALSVPGGMLTVGIPEFRLHRDVPYDEIEYIKSTGVEIKTNSPIDNKEKFDKLVNEFDAVFIAVGAHKGRRMNIPGEDSDGILDGVDFLRNVNLKNPQGVGEKVAVIGAGNVAMDSARTAVRLGAKEVTVIYRRTREEVPAEDEEVTEAMEEGVIFEFLTAPVEVVADSNKMTGLKCIKMELGPADESGRRRPVPISGSDFVVNADMTLLAISQSPDLSFLNESDIKVTHWGTIVTEPGSHQTSNPKVFSAGDCVLGPATAIEAIGGGQKAAAEIDILLGGKGELPYNSDPLVAEEKNEYLEKEEGDQFRPKMPHIDMDKRKTTFEEVKLGYSENDTVKESRRCLRCDLSD